MTMSKFEVARREAAGELGELGNDPRAAETLRELAQARQELLGDDPVEASRRAARRIVIEASERKEQSRWSWRFLWPIGLAPVAATLALVLGTGGLPGATTGGGDGTVERMGGIRAKGPLGLEIFCKRGETVFQVSDGADFLKGDRLRFSYSKGEAGYLTVFGVDDSGAIFPYYQDAVLAGVSVGAGSKVMLPDSVELDGHQGWERVFAVWSARALPESLLREAVGKALGAGHNDIRRADKLPLAVDVDQVSYLLHRP